MTNWLFSFRDKNVKGDEQTILRKQNVNQITFNKPCKGNDIEDIRKKYQNQSSCKMDEIGGKK